MRKLRSFFAALSASVCLVALAGCSNATSESLPRDSGVLAASPAPSLQYIGQWGVKGSDPGQLSEPSGIATDSLGDIFLADFGSAFVSKFAFEGKPLLSFQEDGMNHPQSITIDHGGAIYVADPLR